jgi:hypothetical protein
MTDLLLLTVVGTVLAALVVDAAALIGWLVRRWR